MIGKKRKLKESDDIEKVLTDPEIDDKVNIDLLKL